MKIADFEKAIDALCCDIELEEVKLWKGQVKEFLGRKDGKPLVWDETGRCYSLQVCEAESSMPGRNGIAREPVYDLSFE